MNISNILNLFKYNPATQGNLTFNIEQALNQNWDKIVNVLAKTLMTYDATITYAQDESCTYQGKIYRSKTNNNTGMPLSDTTYWEDVNASFLKKDGSVQMTGVLKTLGDSGMQIISGINGMYTQGDYYIFCSNCYYDGTNWRYSSDGVAMFFKIRGSENGVYQRCFQSGLKNAICTDNTSLSGYLLTDKTGLPLTGGTLNGYLEVKSLSNTNVVLTNTTRQRGSLVRMADDDTLLFANYSLSGVNGKCLVLGNENSEISSALKLSVYGSGTAWKVYGEHNITVSTSAPSAALAEGAQHQVYA
ncbi:hypothetical protein [Aminipila terrae]|uniref:Uncharacterized protein n=1 Tax=Aminipila terrae TaxID=2697030 RepID=A0A6P1MM84_9FIRM|nr:hypothetical protein [Aminipila terrae]QHI73774.1 hypothetical protein Ami3637_16530 [Aminipila terrae]